MAAGNAECRCGVDDVEAVADTLHQSHMCVLPCGLLHCQTHANSVAYKEQVAALQALPLCMGGTTTKRE